MTAADLTQVDKGWRLGARGVVLEEAHVQRVAVLLWLKLEKIRKKIAETKKWWSN